MPRTGPNGEYTLPPNTNNQQPNTTIRSAMFNGFATDVQQALNTEWPESLLPEIPEDKIPIVPIEKGGTGGGTTAEALENLGLDTTVERVEELSDNAVQVDRAQGFTSVQQQQAAENLGLVFRKEYVSAPFAIVANGVFSLTHGLGVEPKLITAELVIVTAASGFAVGDKIALGLSGAGQWGTGSTGWHIRKPSTTTISGRFGNHAAGAFIIIDNNTGVVVTIPHAIAQMIVRAWA